MGKWGKEWEGDLYKVLYIYIIFYPYEHITYFKKPTQV